MKTICFFILSFTSIYVSFSLFILHLNDYSYETL